MLKIYLARHGQNVDNANGILNGRRDKPLTEKGIEQAHEVANKIKDNKLHFDFIYTSPLKRASKTAEVISKTINGPNPVKMTELIERDFGVMTGEEQSRVEELCAPDIVKAEVITYFLNPKGAETFPDLVKRAKKLLSKVQNKHKDENILLVTHGDFGKMLYAAYYNLHWKEVLEMFHFGNSEILLLSPDSQAGEAHVFKILQHNH